MCMLAALLRLVPPKILAKILPKCWDATFLLLCYRFWLHTHTHNGFDSWGECVLRVYVAVPHSLCVNMHVWLWCFIIYESNRSCFRPFCLLFPFISQWMSRVCTHLHTYLEIFTRIHAVCMRISLTRSFAHTRTCHKYMYTPNWCLCILFYHPKFHSFFRKTITFFIAFNLIYLFVSYRMNTVHLSC